MKLHLRNTRLYTKVLLMIGIPFIINACLLTSIYSLVAESNRLSEREQEQNQLLSHMNEIWLVYYDFESTILDFIFTPTQVHQQKAQIALNQLQSEVNLLIQSGGLEPFQRDYLYALMRTTKDVLILTDESHIRVHGDELGTLAILSQRGNFKKIMRNGIGHRRSELKAFLEPQKSRLAHLKLQSKDAQTNVINFVIGALIVNILIVLLSLKLFANYVSNRVKTLLSHAQELATTQRTTNRLTGSDEFATIDLSLEQAAANLDQAFAHRKALMQMIAHDLRSPLAASQILMETLLERREGTEDAKMIDRLLSNSKRMLSLIKDLLLLDALETNNLQLVVRPHKLEPCVREAVETLSGMYASKKITMTVEAENLSAEFDASRIQQVLINLISNAIKFSKIGSEIKVICRESSYQKILIQVIDQGPGIEAEDQERLFQQFFQTKDGKAQLGSGLGLAISKLIIVAHGEKIGCDSTVGKGSTFWFTLPRAGSTTDA